MSTLSPSGVPPTSPQDIETACERFVRWLEGELVKRARGDEHQTLDVPPSGRFWLGTLAPEALVDAADDREERLDPCSVGLRFRLPRGEVGHRLRLSVGITPWRKNGSGQWQKCQRAVAEFDASVPRVGVTEVAGRDELTESLTTVLGSDALRARVELKTETGPEGDECTVLLVNETDPARCEDSDGVLYEAALRVEGARHEPYQLEALPDSFRYDRRVAAYGINCGVLVDGEVLETRDSVSEETSRPEYWNPLSEASDLSFSTLRENPLPELRTLVDAYRQWGRSAWSDFELNQRADRYGWTSELRAQAEAAKAEYEAELARLERGIGLLEQDQALLEAFRWMNLAMQHAAAGRYPSWRPFQVGFLLASLETVRRGDGSDTADVVWFATGGGKTETYLGLLVMAALYDRATGKTSGVTAWTRFPLRMLSLQQTQRFADAFAGAELARREAGLGGDEFGVGFLVGQGATPNEVRLDPRPGQPDPDDPDVGAPYRVLLHCPFCGNPSLTMSFERRAWRLAHRCDADGCPHGGGPLPFFLVDQEVYRFLPAVVVGTLDKAALVSLQAAMRGLVGPPWGRCSVPQHGFVYAPRRDRPHGCLVPGCRGTREALEMPDALYGPTYRLQDELHLLRDTLGAVDAHYEALLDHLQNELTGRTPHILASSATLAGQAHQVSVLYRRASRVFPVQGPSTEQGFWTAPGDGTLRRFVGLAPRGATMEHATDRLLTDLQQLVRDLRDHPERTCRAAGIDPDLASQLLDLYGTDVVYGNTLRDLDAVLRSAETQVEVAPLNTTSLTGRTPFEDVRRTLDRLEEPEEDFDDRVHVVAASQMMSHGVDIDRLNCMVMLGLPLTTAEFIQATARIGRRFPGLVCVLHKIGRERDAGVYRAFPQFVSQGDRFVEAVPITRRSRRVLERTMSGIVLARLRLLHERRAANPLTTAHRVRQFVEDGGIDAEEERLKVADLIALDPDTDTRLLEYVDWWVNEFIRLALRPPGDVQWPDDLCPTGSPMRSLRDVEAQAPIKD